MSSPQLGASASAWVMAGTREVGSDSRPLAAGVRRRATSALGGRRSSSLAARPTGGNMRRRVLRWSMAMMENTWLSFAMSSSVPVRAFVAYVMSFLGRLPDEIGERQSLAVKGERGQQSGPGDARLYNR